MSYAFDTFKILTADLIQFKLGLHVILDIQHLCKR